MSKIGTLRFFTAACSATVVCLTGLTSSASADTLCQRKNNGKSNGAQVVVVPGSNTDVPQVPPDMLKKLKETKEDTTKPKPPDQ